MNRALRLILPGFMLAATLATGCKSSAPMRSPALSQTFRGSGLVVTATSSLAGLCDESLPVDKPTGFWKELLLGPELPSTRQTLPRIPQAEISSYQGIVEKTVDWRTLGASPREVASYARQESAVA